MNTRNSAVGISKHLPTLFQASHQTNQLFNLNEGSTNNNLNFDTVEKLEQNTGNASEELRSAFQFSKFDVFFGLILNSPAKFHIKAHQIKEQT